MSEGRDLPSFLFDPEVNRAINDALPEIVVDAFGLLTRLGDGATLVALALLLYWFGAESDRHKRVMVLAIAVSTLALVAGIKGILEVQRPLFAAQEAGNPLAFAPDTYEGFSTPSAHSMGAAAVYGALAVVMDAGKRWQRYAVAGFLIVAIPFSRVVLGLHYIGDVVTGTLLGLLLVAVALRITKRSVTPMFGLSLVIALGAFALGSREFTTMAIGASLGGLIAWSLVEDRSNEPAGASMVLFGILLIPAFAIFRLLEFLISVEGGVEVTGIGTVSFLAMFETLGFAVIFGVAVAAPYIAAQFNETKAVYRLQTVLPFEGRLFEPKSAGENPDYPEPDD